MPKKDMWSKEMDKIHLGTIFFIILILMGIALILSAPGCKTWGLNSSPLDQDITDTPKERFTKAVKSVGWLLILSVIGASVSAFALLNGSKWALSSLIGSIVMLGLSLVISRYAELLALISLICIIGGIGFFIYSVIVKRKALKEIVMTVEKIKPHLSENGVTTFFKDKNNPDSAPAIQSQSTEKLVAKIKDTLPERENK